VETSDVLLLVGTIVLCGAVLVGAWGLARYLNAYISGMSARRARFLASAIESKPLLPAGSMVTASFRAQRGARCAVWLDLSVASQVDLCFDLLLTVQLGRTTLLDEVCAVDCTPQDDCEIRIFGLPDSRLIGAICAPDLGGSASKVRGNRVQTVVRAFHFDVPSSAPADGAIRARVTPSPGVVIEKMNLLVTLGTWPS
jgi:hypothetical protein